MPVLWRTRAGVFELEAVWPLPGSGAKKRTGGRNGFCCKVDVWCWSEISNSLNREESSFLKMYEIELCNRSSTSPLEENCLAEGCDQLSARKAETTL